MIAKNQWQSDMAEGVLLAKENGTIEPKTVDTLMHSICSRERTEALDDANRQHQQIVQERERRKLDELLGE